MFASFSPDIQPNVTFLTEIIAIGSNSLKKTIKQPSLATFGKKMKKTPKIDENLRKFGISRQIWAS